MEWIKQEDDNLMDLCCGSTVLIKFKDKMNGITIDDGTTVEISWIRDAGNIITESGTYSADDVLEWLIIK